MDNGQWTDDERRMTDVKWTVIGVSRRERWLRLRLCAGIVGGAPVADAGAGLFGNVYGDEGAGRVDGGGVGVGDGVTGGATTLDAVEESAGVVSFPVLGGFGVGRVDDEMVGFG